MNRPLYLYHASPQCDLKIIEPRKNTAPEGFKKGPVVFATDSFPFVTQFLVPHDDSWANGGAFGSTYFFVISDGKRFKKVDKGGCVYLVLSDNFIRPSFLDYICYLLLNGIFTKLVLKLLLLELC